MAIRKTKTATAKKPVRKSAKLAKLTTAKRGATARKALARRKAA
jgi:hypothetical protein